MLKVVLAILTVLSWATLVILTRKLWSTTDATAHIGFICAIVTLPIPALTHYLKRPALVTASASYALVIVLLGVIDALRH